MSNKPVRKMCLAVWAASAVVCASTEKTDSALLEIVRLASDR